MDPDACLDWMLDPEMPWSIRLQAAKDLRGWLERDGFVPVVNRVHVVRVIDLVVDRLTAE